MTDYTWKYLLLLSLLFTFSGCSGRNASASDSVNANAPAAPTDPTKPATATWVEGSWLLNGNTRTWQPAHWDVQQGGQVMQAVATIAQPVQVVQQPVQVIRYVGRPSYENYPYEYPQYQNYPTDQVIYTQPCVPNRVSIFGGFTGASYGIQVYQPQCRVQYYQGCQNDGVIRLHRPGRGY